MYTQKKKKKVLFSFKEKKVLFSFKEKKSTSIILLLLSFHNLDFGFCVYYRVEINNKKQRKKSKRNTKNKTKKNLHN